jgi:DNA-binding response OmpR family regulator
MKDKKVLIIDPDFESVKSLHQLLKDFECQVIVAYDGEQGLEKAKTEDPDLIILEAMLPRLKGFDICAIIANDFERKIPIVILSEFYQDFKDIILQKFGAEALLKKPVDKEELHYTLFDLLKKSPENEAYRENGNGKDSTRYPDVSQLSEASEYLSAANTGNNGKEKEDKSSRLNAFISPSGLNGQSDAGNNGKDHKKKIDVDMLFKKIISEFEVRQERKRPAA